MTRIQSSISNWFKVSRLRIEYPNLELGKDVRIARSARIQLNGDSRMRIGHRVHISPNVLLRADRGAPLHIGDDSFIGQGSVIAAVKRISIGSDALIAESVTIRDQDHGLHAGEPYRLQATQGSSISIGNNVWLGAKATILKGVSIGSDAVVGANSTVTKDVESGTVVAGVPAKFIKSLS